MQRFFSACKSISVVISVDVENTFDKVQHPIMIKQSQESGHRGNVPQYSKGHL